MENKKILLEMLNIAIKAMNENELCYYCTFYQDCERFHDDILCFNGLYDGLKRKANKNLCK